MRDEKVFGKPLVGGDYTLVDSSGAVLRSTDLHGRYVLLYFGFTHCPDLCPTEMTKIADALRLLGTRRWCLRPQLHLTRCSEETPGFDADVLPVMITVDPARDRPSVLTEFKQSRYQLLQQQQMGMLKVKESGSELSI